MAPPNWPQVIVQAGLTASSPNQPSPVLILDDVTQGKLGTGTLGAFITWSDLTQWLRSGSISRPADRAQGPIYDYQMATAGAVLNNQDGRFDPANLTGPYVAAGVTQLNPMVPFRFSAAWNDITYNLFTGYIDTWDDDGVNYAGNYAKTTVTASDAQKILSNVQVREDGASGGSGETTDARIKRILGMVPWYTSIHMQNIGTGISTVQTFGGQSNGTSDSAWSLMSTATVSEAGELYMDGSGRVTFRGRQQILTDARSNTPQLVLGDSPGTAETAGIELPYYQAPRSRDDTTLANDIHAQRVGGQLQEVQDLVSQVNFGFPRTYQRDDLILQQDTDVANWAQWVLYISANPEDRFGTIILKPLRDPVNLWPHALGREIGDRIQIWRRPPGSQAVTLSSFDFESGIGAWTGAGNCNVSQSALQAHGGTKSLALTSIAAGDANAGSCGNTQANTLGLAVVPDQLLGVSAWFRAAVSPRNVQVGIQFYDSTNTSIVTIFGSTIVTDSTTGWVQNTAAITAPAGAAFCRARAQAAATGAANEVHFADDVLLFTPAWGPITKDMFIRGIDHTFDVSANDWTTTWTLQDASKYGSFLTLDNTTTGQLNDNALAY